jgi:hypothetical protein
MSRSDREAIHRASVRRPPVRQVAVGAAAALVATGVVAVGSLTAQAATPSSFDAVQVKVAFAGSMVVVNEGLTQSPCLQVAPGAWTQAAVPSGSGESIAVNLYRDNGSCSGTPIHIVRTVPANPESLTNLWLDLTNVR